MITAQGIGSGLDVASIVSQLVAAEGQPAFLRLATREASIQSELSALGSLKSALSAFQDALDPIKDIDDFRSRKASSSDDSFFTAAAGNKAVPSSYDIEILNLAQSHKIASEPFAQPTSVVGYGELTIQLGSSSANRFTVDIRPEDPIPDDLEEGEAPPAPSRTTLAAIRDAINSSPNNIGVGASIVQAEDGARLVLTSTKTGLDNEITITAEDGDGGLEVFEYGPDVVAPQMTELRAAVDATIKVDSFTRTSSSNTITDVIDGVTLNLLNAEVGTINQLSVEYDTTVATEKVNAFVEAYNSLIDSFREFSNFDAETNTASTLLGDSTLREVSSALRREIGGGSVQGYGFYRTLSSIGVTTNTDGKLEVDSGKLSESLSSDFDSVGRLLADEDGFATRLDAVLEPFVQLGGRIDSRTDGLEESIDVLTDQRDRLNLRLASVEERYLRQFSALDGIINQLTSTSNFLSQQLASLPTANFNR